MEHEDWSILYFFFVVGISAYYGSLALFLSLMGIPLLGLLFLLIIGIVARIVLGILSLIKKALKNKN